jgi:peptide/nickel transport system ATP-binding protein
VSAQPVPPVPSSAVPQNAVAAAPERNVVDQAPKGEVVLKITDLCVRFPSDEGPVNAVQDLTYEARLGRTLAIVGESGSGKSVSSMAVLGLHNPKRSSITGSILLDGTEIVGADEADAAQVAQQHRRDDLPGPAVGPAPLL